jgi:hypothetical protein
MSIVTEITQSNKYRILMNVVDGAGGELRPVWFGRAENAQDAVDKATLEARGNGWAGVCVTAVYVKKEKPPVTAGGLCH